MADAVKGRLRDPRQRRRYWLAAANSATALPLSHALAVLKFSPNTVSAMSLFVSLLGLATVATGGGLNLVVGALLVHLGLVLDHADGQVARLRGMGSTWGMYLDMVIDRIVETGLIVATVAAALGGLEGPTTAWTPLPDVSIAATAVLTLGAMLTWRFLNAYNDVLYLRSHLLARGQAPEPAPNAPGKGFVVTRDWNFLIWVIGTITGQHQGLLLLLLALHVLLCAGKVRAFWKHHRDPTARAAAVMAPDYH